MHVEVLGIAALLEAVNDPLLIIAPESLVAVAHRQATAEAMQDHVILAVDEGRGQRHLMWPLAINPALRQLALAPHRQCPCTIR